MTAAEFEDLAAAIRLAGTLVERLGPDEAAIMAELGPSPHEDAADIVRAFVKGRA